MEAITFRLGILDKEIEKLANDIKALYDEKKTAKEEDKAELQERINKLEAEKVKKETKREKLEDKLQGEGMQTALPINLQSPTPHSFQFLMIASLFQNNCEAESGHLDYAIFSFESEGIELSSWIMERSAIVLTHKTCEA